MASGDVFSALAVAHAASKAVGSAVKTRREGNLRAAADAELVALWESTGAKQVDMRVGGVKVGSMSLKVDSGPRVVDESAFEDWLREEGLMRTRVSFEPGLLSDRQMDQLISVATAMWPAAVVRSEEPDPRWSEGLRRAGALAVDADGQAVPGVAWEDAPVSTTVRGCSPGEVAAAMRQMGDGTTVLGLLEEASDD